MKSNPREIAQKILANFSEEEAVEKVSISHLY